MGKNKRREAEKNLGLFLTPADGASGGGFLVPMDHLNVGPGKPGPEDEWKVPMGPINAEDAQDVSGDDERPVAEGNLGLFFNDPVEGGGGFLAPMSPLSVGPGQEEPGDAEFVLPLGPISDKSTPASPKKDVPEPEETRE